MLNVGIIGGGYWGLNYVRVFQELPSSRVGLVCDERADRRASIEGRFPGVRTVADVAQAVSDPEIDALVVATPATTHFRLARKCLEHGKHVLVEKPLTTCVDDGQSLVQLALRSGLALMVGHTFLFNAGIQKVKECMSGPDFGRVYYLHATRTNLGPIRHDVDAVWDLAPHDIAIFDHLLDSRPLWASGVGVPLLGNHRDDVAFITLGYPGGVIANIHVSWADPNKVRQTVVVGSNRRIVFDDLSSLDRVRVFEKGVAASDSEVDSFGEFRLLMRDGDIISPRVEATEPLKEQCKHFLDCIERGTAPLTDGETGVNVVRVMEAATASIRAGGARVEIGS